jgi:transposase
VSSTTLLGLSNAVVGFSTFRAFSARCPPKSRESQPLRGERLVGCVPHGHWKTSTLIAGLRHDAIVAPFVINGAIDGNIFRTYVEQCLAPTLDRGDIVFMDNLSTHKVAGVKEAIEAADATVLYLPAYSPDLNPIEQVFSKLKALLRKAAERTIPGLWRRIRTILRTVSETECLNFFRHAGYE